MLKPATALALCGMAVCQPQAAEPRPVSMSMPNVVMIIADDLGYGDASAYAQGKLKTPAIDALAREGVRMTSAYASASTCTPSRYSMMTGEYPWRQRGTDILQGDAALIINPARMTLPRIFKNAGYTTALIGKWHLGLGDGHVDFNKHVSPGPNEIGFDYTFNMAATGDRVPTVYLENGDVVNLDPRDPIAVDYRKKVGTLPTLKENPEKLRIPAGTDQDGTIINGLARIGFMSGGTAAIWQDHSLADTFNAKALRFIRDHRSQPFFLYYAAHEPHAPRDPNPRFVGRSGISLRGDAVLQLDDQVAALMKTLKEEGLDKNTLVIFSSDNGALNSPGNNAGGHRANGVLRGGKFNEYEGGVRMPFIARWAGHIPAGRVCDQIVSLIDFPALAASLTHQALQGNEAPDSIDPMPALTHCAKTRDYVLLGNPPPADAEAVANAVRTREWKLIARPPNPANGMPVDPSLGSEPYPRLYRIGSDVAESRNLAETQPATVRQLLDLLDSSAKAGHTRPGATAAGSR